MKRVLAVSIGLLLAIVPLMFAAYEASLPSPFEHLQQFGQWFSDTFLSPIRLPTKAAPQGATATPSLK